MLVDLTLRNKSAPQEGTTAYILEMISSKRPQPVRLAQGIYQVSHWNPEYFFNERLDDGLMRLVHAAPKDDPHLSDEEKRVIRQAFWDNWRAEHNREIEALDALYREKYNREWTFEDVLPRYGIVDTPQQILELFPHIADDDVRRVVTCVEIRREHEPSSDGWRYHKWGEYYGNQNPEHEYLYHDTHIDAVWTFHIYEVL